MEGSHNEDNIPPLPIPVLAARQIADRYCYDQVVILARRVGDGGLEHVTTYGINKEHCDVASKMGDHLKYNIMGWDKATVINHESKK